MSDYRQWQEITTMILPHFAARNGQGHWEQSIQMSMEWTMLIMVGGSGMKRKVVGGQATAYG
jgi:hypothetical protein